MEISTKNVSTPNHQQDAARPTVNKTHSQFPKDAPSVVVRKNPHTKTPHVAPQSQATFIPVNIIDSQGHSVEIVTPHGAIIRLTDASARYIAELLNALTTC
jgi:hypothetical protein